MKRSIPGLGEGEFVQDIAVTFAWRLNARDCFWIAERNCSWVPIGSAEAALRAYAALLEGQLALSTVVLKLR
jgi:hypothetical protein